MFIEFTLSTLLEAGTGGGADVVFRTSLEELKDNPFTCSVVCCKVASKSSTTLAAPSRFWRRSQVASQIGQPCQRTKYSVRAPLPRLARMLSTSYSSPSDEVVAGGGRVSARVRKGNASLPSWYAFSLLTLSTG